MSSSEEERGTEHDGSNCNDREQKFKSKVQIKAKGKTVDAKSILMIMSMGLVKGTEITIVADGPDEADAVKALKELVESKFGEE